MVTYDYECTDCGNIYEILHKKPPTKKQMADFKSECCDSPLEKKLSAPYINTGSSSGSSSDACPGPDCELIPIPIIYITDSEFKRRPNKRYSPNREMSQAEMN